MYADRVIEANIAAYEARAGHKLARIENAKRDEWRAHLDARLAKAGGLPELNATLTKEENLFVRNERVLSTLDFSYWCHYAIIERDGGGICKFDSPWESTRIFLRFIAGIEQDMHDQIARGHATPITIPGQPLPAVSGIMLAINKARQTAATTIGRLISMHRLTTQTQRRALAASVNDKRIKIMYDRDKLCYDNLPFYLKPELKYDEKCSHLHFEHTNSRIEYQVGTQKSGTGSGAYGDKQGSAGIGVGSQVDISHFTELSTWFTPESLEVDFFPAIPRSLQTFALMESTPMGVGNWWWSWTEGLRQGHDPRWRYIFIPWYAELSKYRDIVPEGWTPDETALLHAQKVADTSPALVGHRVLLPRENLYWWSVNRAKAKQDQTLHWFLTNYAATPEESFQNTELSAFDADFLARLRDRVRWGEPHEFQRATA